MIEVPKPGPLAPGLPVMTYTLTVETDDPDILAQIEAAAAEQGIVWHRVNTATA